MEMYVKGNTAARGRLALLLGAAPLAAMVLLTAALLPRGASASTMRDERYVVLGTIESVDNAGNAITVRLPDGREKTLRLAQRMVVNGRAEGMSRAASELVPQERAVISYKVDGMEEKAVDVESLDHAMPAVVTGSVVSADKAANRLVLRLANGREEIFRVKEGAVIETADGVTTFFQFEPQQDAQITLHFRNAFGMAEVSRLRR